MPGYIIHLVEAEMILKRLRQHVPDIHDASDRERYDSNWSKSFLYGNLMPDAVGKQEKERSHFWKKSDEGNVIRVPDLQAFMKTYREQLKTPGQFPFVCGYFTHLYLDHDFFQEYFKSCASFLDARGQETRSFQEVEQVLVKKQRKKVDAATFFSDEYLYGDYTKLNRILIEKYQIKIPDYKKDCKELFQKENNILAIKEEAFEKLFVQMRAFIADSSNGSGNAAELRVLSQDTLELFLEKIAAELADRVFM